MTLRELIAADTQRVLMNTEDFAEVLTFKQAGMLPTPITALMSGGGPTETEVTDTEGFLTKVQHVDWQVRREEFGEEIPKHGTLERSDGSLYELCPVGNLPAVEWFDDCGRQLLVHTKLVRDA